MLTFALYWTNLVQSQNIVFPNQNFFDAIINFHYLQAQKKAQAEKKLFCKKITGAIQTRVIDTR